MAWIKKSCTDQNYRGMTKLKWATVIGVEGVVLFDCRRCPVYLLLETSCSFWSTPCTAQHNFSIIVKAVLKWSFQQVRIFRDNCL